MREMPVSTLARRSCVWLVVGVLVINTLACSYQNHWNMGATEKWANSDMNIVSKGVGMIFLPVIDAVFSPFTMLGDQIFRGKQYDERHKYLSYAGSRSIARSHMDVVYQWWASLVTIPIETVWLPVTGLVDLCHVMWFGDDGTDEG